LTTVRVGDDVVTSCKNFQHIPPFDDLTKPVDLVRVAIAYIHLAKPSEEQQKKLKRINNDESLAIFLNELSEDSD